jgi:nitroreductase
MTSSKANFKTADLLQALSWRYAVKLFDASREIPLDLWTTLEDSLVLTPSSYGMQPWKIMVIRDKVLREKLVPYSWNQRQVADCSHYVIFGAKMDITLEDVGVWIRRLAEVRDVEESTLAGYRDWMVKDLVQGPRHAVIHEWAARQCYIALGNLMTSAALLGIDTCPMEGIEPPKYDELLGLPALGYKTVVACAVGYRSPADKYAGAAKVRFDKEQILLRR